VVLRGIGFVALAALIVPAFGVLSALIAVVVVALLVGFVLRPKIQVSSSLPDRIIVDQSTRFRYELRNVSRLPAYNLCVRLDDLPEAIEQVEGGHVIPRLGPGDTAEVTVAIHPRRRGRYSIKQPVCQSSFPFNLFSFGTSRAGEETLIVLPAFYLLQMSPRPLSRQVHTGGIRLAGRTGVFLEYAGNRPFLAGDSPHRIDARAWARLSVPATKEYHDDSDSCAALVLDTRVPEALRRSGAGQIRELEAAVSLCASVAFTINNDCLIDMLLAGPDLHNFTARPRTVRLDKIHEILAGVEPSAGYRLEQMEPTLADRFYQMSEVFFILLSWDRTYWQLLEWARQAGCHSTVLLIGDESRTHSGQEDVNWAEDVTCLSPEQALTGQIESL